MTALTLYDYHRSSASYRVRIALNLKRCDYSRRDISLLDGEQRSAGHLARNPQGFVPALDIGGTVLTQSLAIIEWLDAAFPEPRLIPADPIARAQATALALAIACDIHPLNNLRVLRYLKDEMAADQAARDRWYRHWVAEGLAAIEAMAGDAPFLGGDRPGIADLFLVPQLYNARRLETPLDALPRLVAIDARASAIDAFAAAHPDRIKPPA